MFELIFVFGLLAFFSLLAISVFKGLQPSSLAAAEEGEAQEPSVAGHIAEIRSAAEQGNADAQYKLGFLYADGQGVPQDYVEARKWLLKAAEQGHGEAQLTLGVLYDQGRGVVQDYVSARKWFLKAAEQGHAEAQSSLGLLYYLGHGVTQDYVEARKWLLKAVEQGHTQAQIGLGLICLGGQGVAQDYVEARKWYLKAAEQGHAKAQSFLGSLYYLGRGGAKDYVEARKWWLKAAEQGDAGAQSSLGSLYQDGLGVAQDDSMAYVWYDMAAAQGDADAKKNHDLAAANLDATSLAEAQKLSKEYFNRDVAAQTQTTYEDVVAGMKCTQSLSGHLECDYRVGRSLHFTIVAPGQPDGSIYFYSASIEGDYLRFLDCRTVAWLSAPARPAAGYWT